MIPLIDADGLIYEVGFGSQMKEVDAEGNEIIVPHSWQSVQDLLEHKIKIICDDVFATSPPRLFLTNTEFLSAYLNRQRIWQGEVPVAYVPNFRMEVALEGGQEAYKGNRKAPKPFHYHNLMVYMLSQYDCWISEQGLEADDWMAIQQVKLNKEGIETVICSRDKDLRMVEGNYYAWEMGKQNAIGPIMVDELGYLEDKGNSKIFGTGAKWFYAQLIIGDKTDNIKGIKGKGDVYAYKLLHGCTSVRECFDKVAHLYKATYGEDAYKTEMKTQANLLYMIRELDEDGEPVRWKPPKKEIEDV